MTRWTDTELPRDHRVAIFSLDAGRELAERVCRCLGIAPGRHEERDFDDGEHKIRPLESVRDRDVYVVQSFHGRRGTSVDALLVRVLFLVGALRDAGARRVTCVAPYLCYARKDRRTKPRDPVSSRYLAGLFEAVGTQRMVVVDVHNPAAYQNAFRIPADHLTAASILAGAVAEVVQGRRVVVVSPDAGGTKRARKFRQALAAELGEAVGSAFIDKARSEGVLSGGAVVGDVSGRVVVVIDDLVSSGGTLARAAAACRERGAVAVCAAATHAVLAPDARSVLGPAELERIIVTDTVDVNAASADLPNLDVQPCAPLVAAAIRGLHTGSGIASLTDT